MSINQVADTFHQPHRQINLELTYRRSFYLFFYFLKWKTPMGFIIIIIIIIVFFWGGFLTLKANSTIRNHVTLAKVNVLKYSPMLKYYSLIQWGNFGLNREKNINRAIFMGLFKGRIGDHSGSGFRSSVSHTRLSFSQLLLKMYKNLPGNL